ncbi:MAG: hypothetical protein IPM54_06680 [Polyangiaceae bacterium]|nr:hypothetical protein [Polyangiaceae bacterium]
MQSQRVEFRLLQLLCNPVGDERVTVALIHWDGRQIRFAWNPRKVPNFLAHVRSDINAVLGSIRQSTHSRAQTLHLSFGLDHIFPVPEGYGSLLMWAPLRVGVTSDPQAHFAELINVLNLRVPGVQKLDELSHQVPKLAHQLSIFGEQLISTMGSAASSRVRIRYTVAGLREYESPLSWMNGRWHHSFPLNLTNVKERDIIGKYEKALGRIDVSIPPDDIGFIIAIGDHGPDEQKRINDIEKFIIARSYGRVDCMSAFRNQQGLPEFGPLGIRVEQDVMASMTGASNLHKSAVAGASDFNVGSFGMSRVDTHKLPPKR